MVKYVSVCLFVCFIIHGDLVFIFILFSVAGTLWKSPKTHGLLAHGVSTKKKKEDRVTFWFVCDLLALQVLKWVSSDCQLQLYVAVIFI